MTIRTIRIASSRFDQHDGQANLAALATLIGHDLARQVLDGRRVVEIRAAKSFDTLYRQDNRIRQVAADGLLLEDTALFEETIGERPTEDPAQALFYCKLEDWLLANLKVSPRHFRNAAFQATREQLDVVYRNMTGHGIGRIPYRKPAEIANILGDLMASRYQLARPRIHDADNPLAPLRMESSHV